MQVIATGKNVDYYTVLLPVSDEGCKNSCILTSLNFTKVHQIVAMLGSLKDIVVEILMFLAVFLK